MSGDELRRHLSGELRAALADEPAVFIQGPRQSGKTTIAVRWATDHGVPFLSLDDADLLRAVRADPTSITAYDRVAIDEVQRGGQDAILAIKRSIDLDRRPGRFLLTGSTNFLTLPTISESLAGRIALLTLWPFSQDELRQRTVDFVTRAFARPASLTTAPPSTLVKADYLELIAAGGFPALRQRTGTSRSRWIRNYIDTVVQRDILELDDIRRADVLPTFVRYLFANSSQELRLNPTANALAINERTAAHYLNWLETVFLVHSLPPWSRNLNNRTAGSRKWYGADTGVIAGLLNRTPNALLHPTEPLTGPLVETFVVNEIRRQLSWSTTPTSMFHYRDRDGNEVDLVLETDDGRVGAIEIKASSSPGASDHRGLELLRDRVDRVGGEFVFGLLLHTGPHHLRLGDRISSAPIETLWNETT